jgi:formate dehydrogenase subunit delta
MRIERLVEMANDIGAFFDAKADKDEAARDIALHLRRFWDPRMRREILAHYRQGGHGLHPTALAAVGLLAEEAAAAAGRDGTISETT